MGPCTLRKRYPSRQRRAKPIKKGARFSLRFVFRLFLRGFRVVYELFTMSVPRLNACVLGACAAKREGDPSVFLLQPGLDKTREGTRRK